MRRTVLCFLASLQLLATASGQSNSQSGSSPDPPGAPQAGTIHPAAVSPRGFIHDFGRDEWRIWSSPFRRGSYGSKTVQKYVIPFAVISAALIATDKKTAELLPNTPDQSKWSGRVSQIGAAYSLAGITGGAYLLGRVTGNRHVQESGLLAMEAIAHSQVVVFAFKQFTNRSRPARDRTQGGFWDGGDSFPSGHATTAFAVATVFAYEYRDHIAVPITAYLLASVVAASRVSAQRHWVSDVVVGGSTGFLLGRFVYKHHHDPSLPGSPVSKAVPHASFGARSVFLNWRF